MSGTTIEDNTPLLALVEALVEALSNWLRAARAGEETRRQSVERTAAGNLALALRQTERAERAESRAAQAESRAAQAESRAAQAESRAGRAERRLAELDTRMFCGHPRAALDAAMGVCTVCELVQRAARAELDTKRLRESYKLDPVPVPVPSPTEPR